jgi:hypothetical protein
MDYQVSRGWYGGGYYMVGTPFNDADYRKADISATAVSGVSNHHHHARGHDTDRGS